MSETATIEPVNPAISEREPSQTAATAVKEEKQKRKYKKRETKKQQIPEKELEASSTAIVDGLIKTPCAIMSMIYDAPGKQLTGNPDFTMSLSETEEKSWKGAAEGVLKSLDYSSDGKWIPWIVLAIVAATTAAPRISAALQIHKAQKASQPQSDKKTEK